jgi:hypothetical protein
MAQFEDDDAFEQTFGIDFDLDDPQEQGFGFTSTNPDEIQTEMQLDPTGDAQDKFLSAANEVEDTAEAAKRGGMKGFWNSLGENKTQRILNAIQIASAGLATYAAVDPAKTGAEFRKIAQARMEGMAEREHEKSIQDQRIAAEKEIQASRFEFERGEAETDRKFKFEYQDRDAKHIMKKAFVEHGWDMDLEDVRQSGAMERLTSDQKASLRASMVNHGLGVFPEGDVNSAISWANCAVYGSGCGSTEIETFAAGLNKNARIDRLHTRAGELLGMAESARLLPAGVQINELTGSPEPVPMSGAQTLGLVSRILGGESAADIAGTLVQDAQAQEVGDALAALEARALDGDADARAAYLRTLTGQAEAEDQQVSDYDLVRQGRRLNGTVAELVNAGAYSGDIQTVAKSFANADADAWLERNPDALDAGQDDFIPRASASILERAHNEGWDAETTEAALTTGLTRAMNKRAMHRGIKFTKDTALTIATAIAPHIRFMVTGLGPFSGLNESGKKASEAIKSYRETQF